MSPGSTINLLSTAVQQYAWGRRGAESEVASLKKEQSAQLGEAFEVDEGAPYAELWIGTHPNAPSVISNTGKGPYEKKEKEKKKKKADLLLRRRRVAQ